jgi:competence protein ComEA
MDHPSSPPLWGWTAPARRLLLVLATASLGLLWMSRPEAGPATPLPPLVVDPNDAPEEILAVLPRLGPTLAGRIVEARREAPFRSLDDLAARVKGIGPSTSRAIRPHLRFEPDQGPSSPPDGSPRPAEHREAD